MPGQRDEKKSEERLKDERGNDASYSKEGNFAKGDRSENWTRTANNAENPQLWLISTASKVHFPRLDWRPFQEC